MRGIVADIGEVEVAREQAELLAAGVIDDLLIRRAPEVNVPNVGRAMAARLYERAGPARQ